MIDNPADGTTTVIALNRSLSDNLEVDIELRGLGAERSLVAATEIHHANLKAVNTKDAPNTVAPKTNADVAIEGETVRVKLKPASFNVIVTKAAQPN